MRVGVLGLGAMGLPIARHVLTGNFPLAVYNRNRTPVRTLCAESEAVIGVKSAMDLAALCDVVITSLSNDQALEEVLGISDGPLKGQGLLAGFKPGSVLIDTSTVSPRTAKKVAVHLAEIGVGFLDAPVSGGTTGAELGSLLVMVGGEEAVLERVRPILKTFSSRIVRCGNVGSGQYMKLLGQILVAETTLAAAETIAAAKNFGLDPEQVVDVLSSGYGASRIFAELGLRMAHGEFVTGFKAALLKKDLLLARAELLAHGDRTLGGLELVLRLLDEALIGADPNVASQIMLNVCFPALRRGD